MVDRSSILELYILSLTYYIVYIVLRIVVTIVTNVTNISIVGITSSSMSSCNIIIDSINSMININMSSR